ncbi:hypothetical protein AVEN_251565-1 [Araneus ventricosus]|uniref:Repressor of the inhibitor of the protein kinase n=1 Tax=Araneus ventricosus TaxID=182803 RepID=A0A4Y2FG49_ARAVE|nr:hypothetical protein AVEN_251565-1 [Araneus ventricosus]
MNSGGRRMCTSSFIQNELINTFGHLIQSQIVRNVRKFIFYSVLADETTDIIQVEQFSLCVRYVEDQKYKIREDFLTFVPFYDVTGAGLANTVLETLSILGLDLKKMRGQGYDGSATMRGNALNLKRKQLHPYNTSFQNFVPKQISIHWKLLSISTKNICHIKRSCKVSLCCGKKSGVRKNLPKTAISSQEKCDKTFFPNIYILLKLLAVVPASVATVERSFSSLRRLKTYLRNTTSESRLNGLALLSIHKDIKIRDEEVLDKFASVPRNLA